MEIFEIFEINTTAPIRGRGKTQEIFKVEKTLEKLVSSNHGNAFFVPRTVLSRTSVQKIIKKFLESRNLGRIRISTTVLKDDSGEETGARVVIRRYS